MESLGHDAGRAIGCPRCGYDQRGAMVQWREQCPLEGTCSECGLTFSWAELIVADKFEPPWCVEFAKPARRVPMASVKTFLRSFRPWKFWSRMRMAFAIRPKRLRLYCAWLLLPLVFCYAITQALVAVHVRMQVQGQLTLTQLERAGQLTQQRWYLNYFLTLPEAEIGNPEQHEMRIGECRNNIAYFQMLLAGTPAVEQSFAIAILEAVFLPLSGASSGRIKDSDGTTAPYPAPASLYKFVDTSFLKRKWSMNRFAEVGHFLQTLFLGLLLLLLLPMSFILLPVSRRKAKVRWAHVGRIGVYSFAFPVAIVLSTWAVVVACAFAQAPFAQDWLRTIGLSMWLALPLWWWAAISRYLKMPHAGAVAWVMTFLIALLLSPLLFAVLPEDVVDFILGW